MLREEIVVSIPHGGTGIPEEMRALIPHGNNVLWREADLFTNELYTVEGVRTVTCELCRAAIDVNRAPDEMYTEGRRRAEGVIMLSLEDGLDTFREDPSLEQIEKWVRQYHAPFHERLAAETKQDTRFLIDGHSYRSEAAASHPDAGTKRAPVSISNREYCACSAMTTEFFRAFYQNQGYEVSVNDPYPGRYILGTYCNRNVIPGIQIEIRRDLYMDERTLEPDARAIAHFNGIFQRLIDEFCKWDDDHLVKHVTDLSQENE